MTKRFLAFALAFLMLFSSVPSQAFATGIEGEGTAVTTAGETTPETTEETDPPATQETDPPSTQETDPSATEETDPPATQETDPSATEEATPDATEVTVPGATEENVPDATEETAKEQVPLCGLEVHVHTDTCRNADELVCTLTEHEHTETCYLGSIEINKTNDMLYSYNRETGYPTDLNDPLYLAVYNGTDYPGEPAWYSESGYTFFNSSFNARFTQFASRASSVLKSDILNVLTQGPSTDGVKIWGLYSSSGTKNYFVSGSSLVQRENEEKIIRAVKGNSVNVDDYEVVWYVIKFQTDTYWHIDGLVVTKETYNVHYYGNGNTSGGAPNGATGLRLDDEYTVLGNLGGLKKVVDGEEYTFIGWNTQPDGSGTHYDPDEKIIIAGDVTLYAQWQEPVQETLDDSYGSVILSGQKIWVDDNNNAVVRPGSVTVNLYADGTLIDTATANAPYWTFSFDVSDVDNAAEVNFTIGEEPVASYVLSGVTHPDVTFVNPTSAGGWKKISPCSQLNYENTASGKTVVAAKMTSDGTVVVWSPDPLAQFERELILASLEAGANGLGNPKQYIFLSGEGASSAYGITADSEKLLFGATSNWSMFWTGTYSRGSSGTTACSLTNSLADVHVDALKVWADDHDRDGLRPASVTVELYADGTATGSTKVMSESTAWTAQWENLSKYKDGVEIVYTVKEVGTVPGYTVSYGIDDHTGAHVITNTHEIATTSITANKTWVDNNDQDGIRPDSVTLAIYANGVATGKTVTLTAAGGWTANVSGLPLNENGTPITYTLVEETTVGGYTPSTSGTTVTNTHTPETVDIPVTKSWDDNDDQDGFRPDTITVRLLADGTEVRSMTITEADDWKGTFTGLPKYRDGGTEIVYTITEDAVPHYTSSITGYAITNTHKPETSALTVVKVWDDLNNQDGKRADSVDVSLFGNDKSTALATVTLSESNGWTATWNELPKYSGGSPIDYTVLEVGSAKGGAAYSVIDAGYTIIHAYNNAVGSPFWTVATVTNKYTPETVGFNVQKNWQDNDNQDGIRPASVTVELYYKVGAAGEWTASGKKLELSPANE